MKYYGYYNSPIGLVEISTSDDTVLMVYFVEEKKERTTQPGILKETIKQIDEYFKGTRKDFDVKFSISGTEFQKNTWETLMKIPYGETWSYKQQAIDMGNAKAVRAVGNANSKNAISIIIPCHRVIGSNNKLIGYAGGLDKKKWLLEHERENI